MAAVDRILEVMTPGSVTAVVGRPGAGVSTLMAGICSRATALGVGAVLASWERRPEASAELVGNDDVGVPEIINWSADELGRCRWVQEAEPGLVVAVDYLQLLSDPPAGAARTLRARAANAQWRLALGVMAPQELRDLERSLPPALAVRRVAEVLSEVAPHLDQMIVIAGSAPRCSASLGVRAPTAHGTWLVEWSVQLGEPAD